MESVITVYSNNNINARIYPSTIKNPYCIYLPKIENNRIKEYVHIDEEIITKFLYKFYITNICIKNHNITRKEKIDNFINWIYELDKSNNFNKSNWFVIIYKMYKNNILN
tara:strand:- start:914 stop:1243 length:330 start_codon:yes stop_codon:yes gene_type:complete